MRAGWIKITDIDHMTLDDVDSWCLYLDALEDAQVRARRPR